MERLIQLLVARIELDDLFYAEGLVVHIFKKRKTAHLICGIKGIHLDCDIFRSRILDGNESVRLLPVLLPDK